MLNNSVATLEAFSLRQYRVPHRWQNCCLSKTPWRGTENSADEQWESVATLDRAIGCSEYEFPSVFSGSTIALRTQHVWVCNLPPARLCNTVCA